MGSLVLSFVFDEYFSATKKENHMRKSIPILLVLLVMFGLSACAQSATKAGNSPDEQRNNAQKAQGELSSEVNK